MIAGDKIKEARLKRNLSQEDLGNMLGVTKVSVCGYEMGTRTPTLETFIKIIDTLDMQPNDLLNRTISVVCDNEETYGYKITKEELDIIKELRVNNKLYKEVLKQLNKNV